MSDIDRFEAWWQTLNVYDPTLKALAGSAWMEAIRASKPIPPDPHIVLMEAEYDDRMQPQPAEDPDEWVIQDKVPVRPGIDQVCWNEKLFDAQAPFGFIETCCGSQSDGKMHGYGADGCYLSARCRRRDLPKVEQAEQCTVGCHGPRCPNLALPGKDHCSECADEPQPQKTRVRLWMFFHDDADVLSVVATKDDPPRAKGWTEIHHDSEGFYVENQP